MAVNESDRMIVLSGNKHGNEKEGTKDRHFKIKIALPQSADISDIHAAMDNGVLKVDVGKKAFEGSFIHIDSSMRTGSVSDWTLSKIATPKRNLSTVLAPSRKASIFVLSSDASKVPLLPPPALPPIHLSQTAMERATRGTNPSAVSFAGPDNTLPSVVARMEVPKSKEIISDAWAARIKERQYDINLVTKSMDVYEPLLDDYLWDYFQNPNTRKHLMKLGLIKPDGEIIDFKEFKYAQIRLQKEEKERQVRKNQEERDLDREIEVAIRNKIRRDKVMFHEKYQNMGRVST
ncbi:hypothetical protein BC830DRAFT_1184639, partial [Chytriomyces sp. MP71]